MKVRAVMLVLVVCSTVTLGLAPRASAQDSDGFAKLDAHPWQMRNATAARTGQSASVGATMGQLDWRFPIAGRVPQIAVAQDGSIYLGTVFTSENAWNNESYAYAVTSAGTLKWRQKVTPYEWGASQGTEGGPAVDDAGSVLIPSTNTALVKLSSEGDPIWIYQGNPQAIIQGSPAVLPDQTIRHTISPAGLLALDSAGATLFTGVPQNAKATVAVAANGDMAVSGVRTNEPHGSKDIQYFNANGTLRWEKTSSNGASGTPVFGPDGILYAPFLARAFFPDGTVKWTTDIAAFTAALGNNGVLYFVNAGVVAVNAATGTRLWTAPVTGGVLRDPAVDALGNVFVTTEDGKLWSVSPTGGINWSLQVCDAFHTGPVVAAGGRIVAAGTSGYQKFVFAVR